MANLEVLNDRRHRRPKPGRDQGILADYRACTADQAEAALRMRVAQAFLLLQFADGNNTESNDFAD
jgi:hypothetical protein